MLTKEELKDAGWYEVKPNEWKRKNSFIDMNEGENYCCFSDAVIIQEAINQIGEKSEQHTKH